MGYILPITDHQSLQYVQRDTKVKGKPFIVHPSPSVQTVIETPIHHQFKSSPTIYQSSFSDELQEEIRLYNEKIEAVMSEITGLGRLFNKQI